MKASTILLGIIGLGTLLSQGITAIGLRESFKNTLKKSSILSPFPAGGSVRHLVVENVNCSVVGTKDQTGYQDENTRDSVVFVRQADTLFVRGKRLEPASYVSYDFKIYAPQLVSLACRNANVFYVAARADQVGLAVSRASKLFVNAGQFENLALSAGDSSEITLNADVQAKQVALKLTDRAAFDGRKAQLGQFGTFQIANAASVQLSGRDFSKIKPK